MKISKYIIGSIFMVIGIPDWDNVDYYRLSDFYVYGFFFLSGIFLILWGDVENKNKKDKIL